MITAYAAWDLAKFSGGRFQLGLASQVRGNIVGRFSMPWSEPAAQLEDYIRAVHSIFAAFQQGTALHYQGSHYQFDRLQPYFNPGPIDVPAPQIWAGGVNQRMCQAAGAVADGFVSHATNSHPRFLQERCFPALAEGAERAQRTDNGPRIVVVSKCITAPDAAALVVARESGRREMAFLYSTPSYRPTLTLLGYQDVGERLTALVKENRWADLSDVLTDQVLDELIPQGTFTELPAVLEQWYGGICDGLSIGISPTDEGHDPAIRAMLARVSAIPTRS